MLEDDTQVPRNFLTFLLLQTNLWRYLSSDSISGCRRNPFVCSIFFQELDLDGSRVEANDRQRALYNVKGRH